MTTEQVYEAPVQLSLIEYIEIDKRVDAGETMGLEARWEFGRGLLAERIANGGKQLPHGTLETISVAIGKSHAEIRNRIQFAEEYPTPEEVANALATSGSWLGICSEGLGKRRPTPKEAPPLPDGEYQLIYADPPWRYDFAESPNRREIENQYPTMELDEIKSIQVPVADDAVIFMWTTSPKLVESLEVLEFWGFTYTTCMVWVKDRIGMGYYARQRHELLLIAKRGALPVPEPSTRPDSVIEAPRGEHSAKPEQVYELLEAMYPDVTRLELFARSLRPGWESWGNEV